MGAGEITVIIMLIIGGTWVAAKFVGVVWRFVRAPMLSFADYFFEITSTSGAEREIDADGIGIEPVVPAVVLPAPMAESTGTSIPVPEIASRADVLDILARVKVDNKYLFTGNKLADLFTGTAYAASRNTILVEIAAIREPEKPAVAHRPGVPLKRPANGW